MISALTRVFGPHNLSLAEDVVQDALMQALRQWPLSGIPNNPAGWLYQVAKNKAIDVVRREKARDRATADSDEHLRVVEPLIAELFLDEEIKDDTLRMMFTCCHPELPLEAQIALTLKILGGFSGPEIARALLTNEATIQKRLYRAKQRIRDAQVAFEVPAGAELATRVEAVLAVLYLMFNEGYKTTLDERPIRRDLCLEAMRLCKLLTEHPAGQHPAAFALMALMCLHAARFEARVDASGQVLMLSAQDRTRWDRQLIGEGFRLLDRSAAGEEVHPVQLEAAIAAFHCMAKRYEETDWARIVMLYDALLAMKPSPVVALNRAIALAEVSGPQAALDALVSIPDKAALDSYPFYPAALGEMHMRLGQCTLAAAYFERAMTLTSSPAEQRFLAHKLQVCRGPELVRQPERSSQ